ncbi:MAG: hypothetical protein NTU81_00125 [Candidatus Nomurabacteria bacterium]|nr:hypothetical protein [Candidatus Nomurabacteria bacterium]
MENITINCQWIDGDFYPKMNKTIQISIVAYEHSSGIPARFCTGLIPAIELSKKLKSIGFKSLIRLINPTPIANYCNGWQTKESQFKNIISEFLNKHSIDFFFDEAEQVSNSGLEILSIIGEELLLAKDTMIIDMVQRVRESGRKHGGNLGAENAVLYMAAHPFSWLDMYHSLIWKKQYQNDDYQYVNLMSKPELRFTVLRKFLQEKRPDLSTSIKSVDLYMTVCNTPCYIRLEDEPTFTDLNIKGNDWCLKRYQEIKGKSSNHRRALKDFEALMSFL